MSWLRRLVVVLLLLEVALGASLFSKRSSRSKSKAQGKASAQQPNAPSCFATQREGVVALPGYPTSYIWKSSESSCPKGLVILLQGCGFTGHEWWKHFPLDSAVPSQAMPVESNIALLLSRRGYALASLAPFVNQAKNKCWADGDVPLLAKLINSLHSIHTSNQTGLALTLPVFALGHFKAGFFLGQHARNLRERYNASLAGLVVMNSGIWHKDYKKPSFPPVIFVDMNRNSQVAYHNWKTVQDMVKFQLDSKQFSSDPFPLSDDYFHQQQVLSSNQSQQLYRAMQRDGRYLWPANGLLLVDPTSNAHFKDFKQVRLCFSLLACRFVILTSPPSSGNAYLLCIQLVQQTLPDYFAQDNLGKLHSPLLQVIRKAYGYREVNDEFTHQVSTHRITLQPCCGKNAFFPPRQSTSLTR